MANTLQKPKTKRKKTCAVCMRIRYFLIVAGMLLLALWARPDWRLPPGYDYSAIVGDLFLGAFVVVFLWKYWVYRRSRNQSGADDAAADDSREARLRRCGVLLTRLRLSWRNARAKLKSPRSHACEQGP